jgi:hypothetical protein
MTTLGPLNEFVDKNQSFRKQLNSRQIKRVESWARDMPSENQQGHLIPIQKIPSSRICTYLSNLIPGFPLGDE